MTHTPVAAGTSCDNGDVCDGISVCNAGGSCVEGTPPVLDDGNPCTADACDPSGGVTHTPVSAGTACDDGNPCNGVAACNAGGACVPGAPPILDDGNPCTADSCDPASGVVHEPVAAGTNCDEGDVCDGVDACDGAGICLIGVAPIVDDANPCTVDACDSVLGVTNTPVVEGTSCDDGNACNGLETCSGEGICTASAAELCGVTLCGADGEPRAAECSEVTVGQASVIYENWRFLIEGELAPQQGVDPAALDWLRAGLISGKVSDIDGGGVPGVRVAIHGHPEFGFTHTTVDGSYFLLANGGGALVLSFDSSGYLPVQRTFELDWGGYALLETVVLTAVDPIATTIVQDAMHYQVADSSVQSDSSGVRRTTIVVPPETTSTMTLEDGSTIPLADMTIRATEYTVGENGPNAMPGSLPAATGYTYAVELSVDEALMAGATRVDFSQPVPFYVDNFLGVPVGEEVPVGYYDRILGVWVPSANGRVIRVLAHTGGSAALDLNGDNVAESDSALNTFGITAGERVVLAQRFAAGSSLWRTTVRHFTPWDCNFPYGPGPGAAPPDGGPPLAGGGGTPEPCLAQGSIIECQNQVLRESIALVGTPLTLEYSTERVAGYAADRELSIPLTGATFPASAKRAVVDVRIGGRSETREYAMVPNLSHEYRWDGLDVFGRQLEGAQRAKVRVGYVYDGVYMRGAAFQEAFGRFSGVPMTGVRSRREITLWREYEPQLGAGRSSTDLFPGWGFNAHHFYDPNIEVVLRGDGSKFQPDFQTGSALTRQVGTGSLGRGSDGVDARESAFSGPSGLAVAPDGSIYVSDTNNQRVRRVDRSGAITTVTGATYSNLVINGDCESSSGASLPGWIMAVGSTWRAGASNPLPHRGTSYFFAGAGSLGELRQDVDLGSFATVIDAESQRFYFEVHVRSFDQSPPDSARVILEYRDASDVVLSVFDSGERRERTQWVRVSDSRVVPAGTRKARIRLISTRYNGTNNDGYFDSLLLVPGDGPPAGFDDEFVVVRPRGLALDGEGRLFVADAGAHRVLAVAPDGTTIGIAGTGVAGFSGDEQAAHLGQLNEPSGVAVAPTGEVFIADTANHRVRMVTPSGIITTAAGIGTAGTTGLGGPARQARLNRPFGLLYLRDTLYIAEQGSHRVTAIGPDGILRLIAGSGTAGVPVVGALATATRLNGPVALAERDGALLIAEAVGHRVVAVDENGRIAAVAGTGVAGASRFDLAAVASNLDGPNGLAVRQDGRVFIASSGNHEVVGLESMLPGLSLTDRIIPEPGGSKYHVFSGTGRHLQTREARSGRTLWEFEYEEGRLNAVVDSFGRSTRIVRAASGAPESIVAPFGQVTSLTTGSNGDLDAVTNPAGERHAMTYFAGSLLRTFENPRGGISTMSYDERGKLIEALGEDGGMSRLNKTESATGWTVTRTTANDFATTYEITRDVAQAVTSSITFPDGTASTSVGRQDGTRTAVGRDGTMRTYTSTASSRWGLGVPNVATVVRLPSGLEQSSSESTSVVLSNPDDPSSLLSETTVSAVAGHQTVRHYDAGTRQVTTTTPEGRVSVQQLDEFARVVSSQSPGAPIVRTEFAEDRVTAVIIDPDNTLGNGNERTTSMTYDSLGRLATVTDPRSAVTAFTNYDPADRPHTIVLPDSSAVNMSYDLEGNVSSVTPPGKEPHLMSYGMWGRIESYEPPVGNRVEYFYDADRRMELIDFGPDAGAATQMVDFEYDPDTSLLDTITSPRGTIDVGYTEGRMTSLVAPSLSGPITTNLAYDGMLPTAVSWSGPVAGQVSWTYNNRFLVASETVGALPATTVTYGYDNDGLVTAAGALAITRDGAGRVLTKTVGRIRETLSYTTYGELARQTVTHLNTNGTVRETLYDAIYVAGTGAGAQGTRDALGRITRKTESIVTSDLPEPTARPLETRRYDYGYNAEGRPWLESVSVDGTVVSSYGYDENGNRTSTELNWSTLGYDASFDQSLSESDTEYNAADQLLTYGDTEYTWNSVGQLQSKRNTVTGAETFYEYDLFGNLLSVVLPDGRTVEYEVDGAGRRVGRRMLSESGAELEYRGWIYRDLLRPIAEVDAFGNVVARYVYDDGAGSKQNGVRQLATRLGANQDTSLPFAGENVPDFIELLSGGTVTARYRLVKNQVGTVLAVVDATSGEVAQRIEYDEFGRVLFDSAPGLQPFGFAGGLYDAESGFVRFGARDYEPTTGRWTARDPVRFAGGANVYVYTFSSPINASDIAGLDVDDNIACYTCWAVRLAAQYSCSAAGGPLGPLTGQGIGNAISLMCSAVCGPSYSDIADLIAGSDLVEYLGGTGASGDVGGAEGATGSGPMCPPPGPPGGGGSSGSSDQCQ